MILSRELRMKLEEFMSPTRRSLLEDLKKYKRSCSTRTEILFAS
jgi:hypothetical protein